MSVKLTEALIPLGTAARSGIKRNGYVGVTIHNTGNYSKGAGALNHKKHMVDRNGKNLEASYHYVVDDTEAFRLIPEDEVAWHAGDGQGDGNYKTIAIEICVNADGDITKATDNAVALAKDIISRLGGRLYQHFDWSGKNCPSEIRSNNAYSWEVFKNKVMDTDDSIDDDIISDSQPGGKRKKVYTVDEVTKVNGIWQLRNNYLVPVDFNWTDNGIPLDDIDFTDAEGNILSEQTYDGTQKYFTWRVGSVALTVGATKGSGGYFWIKLLSDKGDGDFWLSAWDLNHLIYG